MTLMVLFSTKNIIKSQQLDKITILKKFNLNLEGYYRYIFK